MTTASILLALFFVAGLAGMSWRAARGLAREQRLPMQWGFDGRPVWSAPRDLALAFTPVLAALTLMPTALLSLMGPSRQGADLFFDVLIGMGLVWIGAHALHLWLVRRWRRAEGL
ncbi:hypothetical protein D3C72_976990 [compost metagenome]